MGHQLASMLLFSLCSKKNEYLAESEKKDSPKLFHVFSKFILSLEFLKTLLVNRHAWMQYDSKQREKEYVKEHKPNETGKKGKCHCCFTVKSFNLGYILYGWKEISFDWQTSSIVQTGMTSLETIKKEETWHKRSQLQKRHAHKHCTHSVCNIHVIQTYLDQVGSF